MCVVGGFPKRIWSVAADTPKESQQLKAIREELRLTQSEMGATFGLSRAQYKNYEYQVRPPDDMLRTARLMLAEFQSRGGLRTLRPMQMASIPVFGSAGAGSPPTSSRDSGEVFVPIEFFQPDYHGIVLEPDALSMLPYLHPGDTLIFKDTEQAKAGKIMAINPGDGELPIVKKIRYGESGIILHSFNAEFPDVPLAGGRVLGFLVGLIGLNQDFRVGPEDSGLTEHHIEELFRARIPRGNI